MKKILVLSVLFVVSIMQFSCTKEEVIPNVTAKSISGNYQITFLALNKTTYEMPYKADGRDLSGLLIFSASKYPQLPIGQARVMIFSDGYLALDDITNIDMEDITSNSCSLYEDGIKIGKYYKVGVNEIIELNGLDDKGNRVIVKCQK
jgi:hypothetical protein